jgi:hypothetical protein
MRLLQRLPATVVRRVHRERHAPPSWIPPVPEPQRLSDAHLLEFSTSLSGAALLAMFRYCRTKVKLEHSMNIKFIILQYLYFLSMM